MNRIGLADLSVLHVTPTTYYSDGSFAAYLSVRRKMVSALWVDIVAKVFLPGGTQILRPVGAAIE